MPNAALERLRDLLGIIEAYQRSMEGPVRGEWGQGGRQCSDAVEEARALLAEVEQETETTIEYLHKLNVGFSNEWAHDFLRARGLEQEVERLREALEEIEDLYPSVRAGKIAAGALAVTVPQGEKT